MNDEDRTKVQNIVRRLRAILDELRELEKTSQDTSVKQMAISAALALAWVLRSGNVIAIPESGSPEHVRENAIALSTGACGI